ncbi:hypothetical protein G6M89_02045 [Natronolimnobius sp. AArcel1]|uniref:hypothetical protein n=1 Tax=Natronolimnobius sp. AArcel1 TaxID=1679093 RepID=UPI0013EAAE5D|nr:hypothetical protein [Natronolimnobius sp. AArcel1]NGM67801.1 hypothetical protein [Natronolimnobius sp. AArcel1]
MTIYFDRVLGPGVLGYYAVALAVVTWLSVGGQIGLASAITKQMSEGDGALCVLLGRRLDHHQNISRYIVFEVSVLEVSRQLTAALAMASVVYPMNRAAGPASESLSSILTTISIVAVGALVYIGILLILSPRFRDVIRINVPFNLPVLTSQ